jgi:hypothetical protein
VADSVAHSVEKEVAELLVQSVVGLRTRWRVIFKSAPPQAFGPDLLRRSIAQRLQEDAYGSLDRPTAKLLNQLVAQAGKNNGKIVVPARIKAGAILVREWKGTSHRVTVADDGFTYQGQHYSHLSEIARLITGTRWNGPRFFGLRNGTE